MISNFLNFKAQSGVENCNCIHMDIFLPFKNSATDSCSAAHSILAVCVHILNKY